MTGYEIKAMCRKKRLFQWEVARTLGITEFTLSRWLRDPVSEQHVQAIIKAIEELTSVE